MNSDTFASSGNFAGAEPKWRRFAFKVILGYSLIWWGLLQESAAAIDYPLLIQPGTPPAASSVQMTLSVGPAGTSQDATALDGTGRLAVRSSVAPFGYGQISELVLELVDGVQFSLLGGLIRVDGAPRATRVRMVEPGPAGDVTGDTFDQKENLFQFEGSIQLSTESEPFDLSSVSPKYADLEDVRLSRRGNQLLADVKLNITFTAAMATPVGQVPLDIHILGTLRGSSVVSAPGDVSQDGVVDAKDIDILAAGLRRGESNPIWDLQPDDKVNEADRIYLVERILRTYLGDSNLDGQFSTTDFVQVFQQGEYEDSITGNSTWSSGDWNGDGDFSSTDFVSAFQGGGFEAGPRGGLAVLVPEPSGLVLMAFGALVSVIVRSSVRSPRRSLLRR